MRQALAGARLWVPLYLVLAFVSGYVDLRVRAHPAHAIEQYIPQVLAGTADPPGRYRVLAPVLHDLSVRLTGADTMVVWLCGRLAWFLLAWVAMHAYLRTWFDLRTAMLGTALVAALLPATYTNSWAHPDHIPELALFTAGCLAAARGRDGWFAAVLALASFNRETAVFLVPVYLLAGPVTRDRLVRTGLMAGLWAVIYVGLRAWLGYDGYDMWQFWRNVEFLKLLPPPYDPYYRAYAWFGLLAFGPLLYLAARAWRTMPAMPRRLLWVVPMVAVVAFTISSIIEARIFTPVLPLILPALVFALGSGAPQGDAAAAVPAPSPDSRS